MALLRLLGTTPAVSAGAIDASVDTGDRIAANAFYTALGFTEAYKGYSWRKWL